MTKPTTAIPLRDYQRKAVDSVHESAQRGLRRPLVAMATGLGKSLCAGYVVKERGGRAVILAHRDELLRQLGRAVTMADPHARIGFVKAEEDDVHADIVIASLQTLARPARLERLLASQHGGGRARGLFDEGQYDESVPRRFTTVIADEAHHHTGGEDENTFGAVLRGLGAFYEDGPLVVGWTATPERGDGKALGSVFEEIVFEMGILAGMTAGYLCNVRAKQVQLAQADFSKLKVRGGDFRDEETAEILMAANAPKHAAEAYQKHAAGRKALCFVPTVAVAEAMTQAFRAVGVPAETAHGGLAPEERAGLLRRFKRGETLVVPNAQLLTEGFDEPSVDCIIMARPTKSRPFAIQMVGRGTRIFPGKGDCLVLDLVGKVSRMDLVTVASLFNVSAEAAEGGVIEAVQAKRSEEESEGIQAAADDAPKGRIVAVDVNLFQKRDFSWVPAGGRFVLSLGDGTLVLQPGGESDEWEILKRTRETVQGLKWPQNVEVKTHVGLSLETAQAVAEDIVRRSGAAVLNNRNAAWRKGVPTDKQVALLQKKRRWREGMTKGEATDAITAMFAVGGGRRR